MHQNFMLLIMFLNTVIAVSQVTIEEIKLVPGSEFHKSKDATVIYPVISTINKETDIKINNRIIQEVAGVEQPEIIRKILMSEISDGLRSLDYKIILETKEIFSIKITGLNCGAYCSSWFVYLNFNLQTGEIITIEEVIDKNHLNDFRKLVLEDKVKAIKLYKKEMKSLLTKKKIDSASYAFADEYVEMNCTKNSGIEKYLLSDKGLEIFDPCEFPQEIKTLQPIYNLKYSYKQIGKFINSGFAAKLKNLP